MRKSSVTVPRRQEGVRVYDRVPLRHVTQRASDFEQTAVSALGGTRVDGAQRRILLEGRDEAAARAARLALGVEPVDEKAGVLEVLRLAEEAVLCERAGEVVDDDLRGFLPSRE